MSKYAAVLYAPVSAGNGMVSIKLGIAAVAPAQGLILDAKHKSILKPVTLGGALVVLSWIKGERAAGNAYTASPRVASDNGTAGSMKHLAALFAKLAKAAVDNLTPVETLDAISAWAPLHYFDSALNAHIPVSAGVPRAGHPCWKLGDWARCVAPDLRGVVKLAAAYESSGPIYEQQEYTRWIKNGAPVCPALADGDTPLDLCIPEKWVAAEPGY